MSASLRVYFQPMLAATHPCSTSAKCLKRCGLAGTRHQPQSLFYQRETPRAGYSLDIPFPPTTLRRDCRLLAWPNEGGGDCRSPSVLLPVVGLPPSRLYLLGRLCFTSFPPIVCPLFSQVPGTHHAHSFRPTRQLSTRPSKRCYGITGL